MSQPSLPPIEEFIEYIGEVWDSKILTHNGPLLKKLESSLESYLGVEKFVAVSNGTIAIQLAIAALGLKGEIITTPFTWIATMSAIKWQGCTPVFCDIDPETLNIDPDKIEECITPQTVAIMPVHVFGNPCDVAAIDTIAKRHHLKVIYDAAHAFGSTVLGESVYKYGDISATSLHCTKMLNTGEGGGCITESKKLAKSIEQLRFFGHDEKKQIVDDGLNAKMSELHAALGLANLKYIDQVLRKRRSQYGIYKKNLSDSPRIRFQSIEEESSNFSYFPIIFESEQLLINTQKKLAENAIMCRRYFYPCLHELPVSKFEQKNPIEHAEQISRKILCLPLFDSLMQTDQERIIEVIKDSLDDC